MNKRFMLQKYKIIVDLANYSEMLAVATASKFFKKLKY